jgi:indolepyruvate ferredoxin oxidoreductase, beta subunit
MNAAAPTTARPGAATDGAQAQRPITVLIAALGGEGGGVLTGWIVAAARNLDLPVQSTSIPGVAQRTGATTYYIEIFPKPWRELGGARPVLALAPGIGDLDMVVASELLEAGRAVAGGFVTPDRTMLIASTHRTHAIAEKIAMADGRVDGNRLIAAIETNARAHGLFDMEAAAKRAGAMINAVMLGAIAGSGRLPIPTEAFAAAIRADGKAVEASLRGFQAGLDGASCEPPPSPPPQEGEGNLNRAPPVRAGEGDANGAAFFQTGEGKANGTPPPLAGEGREGAPTADYAAEAARFGSARDIVAEGLRRLAAYQDAAYARLYLDRLDQVATADARADANGALTREVARHLALRMSYEDVIRVAQAKIAPERLARIAGEIGAKPGEPVAVVEFLKPGIEELCSILPSWLASRIIAAAEHRGILDHWHWGMEVKTHTICGYLRLLMLAKLRRFRPRTSRYAREQATIEAWLKLTLAAAQISAPLALEVAACAQLLKGYGDTLKRGGANYAAIEAAVIRPALSGALPPQRAIDAIASARAAALADPEGEALAMCLAEIEATCQLHIAAE